MIIQDGYVLIYANTTHSKNEITEVQVLQFKHAT